MSKYRRLLKVTVLLLILMIAGIVISNWWVEKITNTKIYSSVEQVPSNKVGLFLGTGKYLSNGYINLYYKYRIQAAVELYKAGKIEYVLVSGDNSRKEYDEPTTIKEDLISEGIPESRIYLDYAGFRTLDSVVRCKMIFGQESITVISQRFHNQRAVFIAENKDIKAVGFNAKDVSKRYGLKVMIREKLARVKMMMDILFNIQPKYLGEKIKVQ